MELTQDIVPKVVDCNSDPSVAVGHLCVPFKVEMVIRGYMSGHAAREYALGKREICGVPMPEGLKEKNFIRPLLRRQQKRIMGT
jgi:phosphoribosylaminoimidazole-succinocarboxamide synthase